MAQQVSGKVFRLYDGRYGGGSFRLDNDPIYYNTRGPLEAFVQPGTLIEFQAGELSRSGKGREVVAGTLKQQTPAQATAAANAPAQSLGSRDESIRYQSSRKDALEMVTLLLANGAVKLPENAAKRAGVIEALVDRFTASYFEDIGDLGALDRAEPVEKEAAEPAPVKAKTKAKPAEEDDVFEDLDS